MPTIRDNSITREGDARLRSKSGTPVYEETVNFIVEADYVAQPRLEILQTPGLPVLNQVYGGYAVVKGIDATRRESNPLIYDVSVELSSEVEENQGDQGNDPNSDPTAWVPVYETKFERLDENVTIDQSGERLVNSAGMAFEEGLTIARYIPVWEFFQFEPATVTDEQVIDRNEVVNSTTFKGRDAKTLLCTVMSSTLGFFYGQRRRLTQYSLKYNEKTWVHERDDTGTMYLDAGSLTAFKDENDIVFLGSLDGSGGKQTDGDPPAVLEFDIYKTNDFSFLRI